MAPHTAGKKHSTSHFLINGKKSMSLLVNKDPYRYDVQEFISLPWNFHQKLQGIPHTHQYLKHIHNNSLIETHKHAIN
jgi:hypothetical protein